MKPTVESFRSDLPGWDYLYHVTYPEERVRVVVGFRETGTLGLLIPISCNSEDTGLPVVEWSKYLMEALPKVMDFLDLL